MELRGESASSARRVLAHPLAFVATTALLAILYGWTFFTNPGRPAPADDPAYIAWRTETLLVETPATVMAIDGPDGMHSTGYRITTPVVAGMMRRILGVDRLTPTAILAVACRVAIALLLAGLVFRHVRDPLAWHTVAIGSGSILLTPPFGGYTDNMIALALITAALYLIEPARTQWPARVAFGTLLAITGLTHPTTLAIFCATLALAIALRAVIDKERLTYLIVPAVIGAGIAVIAWTVGVWGPTAPFSEAALPPPGDAEFFRTRLVEWIRAIQPLPTGVLLIGGSAALVALRRNEEHRGFALTVIGWMAPLIGVLGVVTGLVYPYYRFLNSTLAWVLLAGLGAYFLIAAARRGQPLLTVLAIGVVVLAVGLNYVTGLTSKQWNDPRRAWITAEERRDLDALHNYLGEAAVDDIVFVVDSENPEPERLYGFVKRAGNVSRYGVPAELQDRTSIYLGSTLSLLEGRATPVNDYHETLSESTLSEIDPIEPDDVVVVPEVFNRTGVNAPLTDARRHERPIYVADGRVSQPILHAEPRTRTPLLERWARVVLGTLLLLIPGFLLTRALLTDATSAYSGFAVAATGALVASVTIIALAITQRPLTPAVAWSSLLISNAIAAALAVMQVLRGAWRRGPASPPAAANTR